ncbi:MAG: prephenate dehydratase [Cyanobacteria bacterium J069]|nr:MAG: prephenate dehydratase [Cyanobacteria bacterium J069]
MAISIAHLGPAGTYAEDAAIACGEWLRTTAGVSTELRPYSSIPKTIRATESGETQLSVVPVENSIEGSVTTTLDTLWQLDRLQIQRALVLPIDHALISRALDLESVKTVYGHPQALAQCQGWLERTLPDAQLVPSHSNAEALHRLDSEPQAGAIASRRAASLYNLPILSYPINDYPDNCTRFWVLGLTPSPGGTHTSLAFSVPANVPGALVTPLQIFATRNLNLSRIESRPSKRSLGDYVFFIDIEASVDNVAVQQALQELAQHTETLKLLGSYSIARTA